MFPEISLHILDIVQNSIRANANLIEIRIQKNTISNTLRITIKDNGCGMTDQQCKKALDPFYTTRTTRNVGLGIPFFKSAALLTKGSFTLESKPQVGTTITAVFLMSHIDCMPLGDITNTLLILITMNETIDFLYLYSNDDKSFLFDTRDLHKILGNIPFSTPEVKNFMYQYLIEHQLDVDTDTI